MEPLRDPEGIETEYLASTGALQGRRVLEIGCGSGRLTRRFAPLTAAVAAVDPDFERVSEAALSGLEMTPPPLFIQAEAEKLPFPDGAFDTAIFSWSL